MIHFFSLTILVCLCCRGRQKTSSLKAVKVKDQVNQGQGMDAVGEVSHHIRIDELRPQSFHDLRAVQVKAATRRGKETRHPAF